MSARPTGAVQFFDAEEKELIESFEEALETGALRPSSPAERKALQAKWKKIAKNTAARKAITLRLQQRDIERLKVIALQRGLPYQTLVASVLHQFANGDLKERRD
jgi:predicted DNA binding CopG/RHH family protein